MKIAYIFLVLILVEVGLITIGGLIFSNILGENPPATSQTHACDNSSGDLTRVNASTVDSEYLPFSDSVFFVITTITTIGISKVLIEI